MTPIIHNYSHKAGQTVAWDTSDNEETFLKHTKDQKTRALLDSLGFLKNPIDYKFNSHGFRTSEFDQQFDAVCFGCSFTMGTGIHAKDSWPEQLQAMTGLSVANLGHAGSSNDTAFRFANHYLKFLKPKYAIWLQTDRHRLEVLDSQTKTSLNILSGDTRNVCANDYFIKLWFSSDINQQLNLEKNTKAFQQLCSELNITPIILPRMGTHWSTYSFKQARDLLHPGPGAYRTIAEHAKKLIMDQSA